MTRSWGRLATAVLLPPLVAGYIHLATLLDPWTLWLFGRALGPFLEALDVAVVLNLYAMLVYYIPAFAEGLAERHETRVWRLICGIDIGWTGALLVFANLSYLYMTQERDVLRDSPASPTVRLSYLALVLTGTTFHLATGIQARWGWWRVFALWSFGMAAFVLILAAAGLMGRLPFTFHA